MARRNWSSWPKSIKRALDSLSGILGLFGIVIGILGLTLTDTILIFIGFGFVLAIAVYILWKSFPGQMLVPSDVVGNNLSIEDLDRIYPPILKLGVLGYSQSGKTTFIDKALHKIGRPERTPNIYATVVALQTTPTEYIALLDGDGDQDTQQHEIAEIADYIIIFVDHADGETSSDILLKRQIEHDNFLKQLAFHIKRKNKDAHILFLLNKKDLWGESESAEDLKTWFSKKVEQWNLDRVSEYINKDFHSNLKTDDIIKTMQKIAERITSHV